MIPEYITRVRGVKSPIFTVSRVSFFFSKERDFGLGGGRLLINLSK